MSAQMASGLNRGRRYTSKSLFVYESDSFNVQSGQTAQGSFNTDGDSDFFWQKFSILCLATDTGNVMKATSRDGDLVCPMTMSLTNATTGRSLSNVPVIVANIDGYLQFFNEPMIWPRKSNIIYTLFNEDSGPVGGVIAIAQLSFIGTKAFI